MICKSFIRYITLFTLLIWVGDAYSQSRTELEKQKERTLNEIKKTTSVLNEVSKGRSSSINRLVILNRQIRNRRILMSQVDQEIQLLNWRIEDNTFVIRSMKEDVVKMKEDYAKIIQAAYKHRSGFYYLTYIMASRSINQAYKRLKYMKQYAEYRKKQVYLINQIQDLLKKKNDELLQQKIEKTELLKEYQHAKSALDKEVSQQKKLVNQFSKQERKIKSRLAQQRRQAKKLDKEIRMMIEKEMKKKGENLKLTPEQIIISKDFEKNKGKLPWPTKTGIITESYGVHPHDFLKNVKVRNDGIDITTLAGEKARAVFNGEVMKVIAIPGANQTVIIRHGNYLTVYQNLVNVNVKVGDKISIKQEIGYIYTDKNDGNDTTIGFMIWKETQKLNPEDWLSK
jgi:septal ring factor EnvC (AmiA/AmiB activator)